MDVGAGLAPAQVTQTTLGGREARPYRYIVGAGLAPAQMTRPTLGGREVGDPCGRPYAKSVNGCFTLPESLRR